MRRFQARHGITIDGIVRKETFDRLNIPCEVRLSQLKTNVTRLRELSGNLGSRYVMVNIPAAQVEAVEEGVVVSRHIAIVGRIDRPSPDVNSKIVEVNFNPYWTVPVSIVRRDLIPLMQKDPNYLASEHIHILRPAWRRADAGAGQLVFERRGQLPLPPGPRRAQFARRHPHQFPQQGRRVHA